MSADPFISIVSSQTFSGMVKEGRFTANNSHGYSSQSSLTSFSFFEEPIAARLGMLPTWSPNPETVKNFADIIDLPLTEIEKKVVESPLFQRLQDIRQMTIGLTTRGKEMIHTRDIHSLLVMQEVSELASRLELPANDIIALRLAGLLHDIGHTPFAHAGEEILRSYEDQGVPKPTKFDHEKRGIEIIRNNFQDILGEHLETVVAILDDNHPFSILLKDIDRNSYLDMDFQHSSVSQPIKDAVTRFCKAFRDSIRYNIPDYKEIDLSRSFVITDVEAAQAVAAARTALYSEFSCHTLATLATAVLRDAVIDALQNGALKKEEFLGATETAVIAKLDPSYREIIQSNKIDSFFSPVTAYTFSDFTEDGLKILHGTRSVDGFECDLGEGHVTAEEAKEISGIARTNMNRVEYEIRKALLANSIDQKDVVIIHTPDYEKNLLYNTQDKSNDTLVIWSEVKFVERYFAVVIRKDSNAEPSEVSNIVKNVLLEKNILRRRHDNPEVTVLKAFGNQNPELFLSNEFNEAESCLKAEQLA